MNCQNKLHQHHYNVFLVYKHLHILGKIPIIFLFKISIKIILPLLWIFLNHQIFLKEELIIFHNENVGKHQIYLINISLSSFPFLIKKF